MNSDFIYGLILGVISMIIVVTVTLAWKFTNENCGYSDKMIIEYHCPDKEYERKLIHDFVHGSGIQTNFLNKECSMDKYNIKYRLTNPK